MTQEALKLALDALETELSIDWTNNDEFNASAEKMYEAIAAIKEALAQPEQWGASAVTHPEYVAEQKRKTEELRSMLTQPEQEPWCMKMNGCKTKCEDCPDKVAQPEQEPVAWSISPAVKGEDGRLYAYTNEKEWALSLVSKGHEIRPLVHGDINPPQRTWVGLTGEEAMDVTRKEGHELLDFIYEYGTGVEGVEERIVAICKAIEDRLKEKNSA